MDNNDIYHPQQSSDTKPLTYTTKYVCVLLMYQSDPTIQDNWLAAGHSSHIVPSTNISQMQSLEFVGLKENRLLVMGSTTLMCKHMKLRSVQVPIL